METYEIKILKNVNKKEWDNNLRKSPQGNFFQSSLNGDNLASYYAYEPYYAVATNSEGEIGGSLLFFRGPCSTKAITLLPFKKICSVVLKKAASMITWRGGPIIYKVNMYGLVGKFFEFLEDFASQKKVKYMRIASLPFYDIQGQALLSQAKDDVINHAHYRCYERATVVINLSCPAETLWGRLKKRSRYDVLKAKKDGVSVTITEGEKYFNSYYAHYLRSCLHNRIVPYPKEMVRYMIKIGGKVFIAWIGNRPIAGAICNEFNGIAEQYYLWNSRYAQQNKLFGMHLITWKMIEYYKDRNFRFFDFAGVNISHNRSIKEDGIFKFKTRWGGDIVCYNEFEKTITSHRTIICHPS